MFLKQLDTMGFKSFAERISVDFVPGVTVVVGPNGSGKSNITDALRWVLGEQSAKSLRGAKMEDIIFQGSDSRKALNIAEVTITLDNTDHRLPIDYEEVSVTRRAYRSGESEFLINKQPCRLKDITDLFLDSGLGREAFSIISQGKVEEILSSKSEERRTIFEEAAGVLKYKNRKKKAEYKLAETQENLNRVEDIIYEIENQLEPLRDQASTAKEYVVQKERLTETEISLLIAEIEEIHENWKTNSKALEKMQEELLETKVFIQKQEAGVEKERQDIQEIDQRLSSLQDTLLAQTKELESLEGNKKLVIERLQHFHENKEKLNRDLDELANKKEIQENYLTTEQKKLENLKQERQQFKNSIKKTKSVLEGMSVNLEEKIETLKSEYIELLNDQAAKRNEKKSIAQQLDQMKGKKTNTSSKLDKLLEDKEKLTIEAERINENNVFISEKVESLTASLENLEKEVQTFKVEYNQNQDKLYKGYQILDKFKSKKDFLNEMKEDFQGFFQGVKAVLKARENNTLSGINGAVIELISIEQPYVSALETALGGQAQHVITEDDKSARSAISWLKKTNNGRATFLPISSMQSRRIPSGVMTKLTGESGYVGMAADLVSYDPQISRVIESLLGNVIVANSLKEATYLAQKVQRKYRVVTLEGDIVNPGGSMTGGAKKQTNQSLFSRESELKEISSKVTSYEEKIMKFEKEVNNQKVALVDKEEKLEEFALELQQLEKEKQQSLAEKREKALELQYLQEQLNLYDQDHLQFQSERTTLFNRQQQVEEDLKKLSPQLQSIEEEINSLSSKQNETLDQSKNIQEKLNQQQIRFAELETEYRNQQEKVSSIKNELAYINESMNTKNNEITQLIEFREKQDQEHKLNQEISTKREEKDITVAEIEAQRKEKSTRLDHTKELENILKQHQLKYNKALNENQEIEVKVTRLDVALENCLSKLEGEYEISYERAKDTYEKSTDINASREKVKLIKKTMTELGEVNLGAIEECERIEQRYEFLSVQQKDLVDAKETLYAVIREMDSEMEYRFSETFNRIKDEFTIVFRKLFGGGKAELVLTDPNELLETGVEIVAQPPGKKLQHLGLLSGGERALTAIALLFAILKVRPVPFCVLDEVEAALDEANVARFASYLKDYSKETQFIVITHRKGTMEEADVLYGVTMQESGVSRLVSVKLEETESLVES
ncbi:chromosome segregation protein SMC [Saliterribacillus persicus]|uniref:Chromosome partition protein Smc n=1 Tax=Saliterribacillus persicus TaxID=930114 RepID=A0A368XUB0_9BACI|nr:chromosome segregation protein SMC [Saliterribacillus persicus]RCW70746.1 condensin subunit Smc [Saliterribacillus persicus]